MERSVHILRSKRTGSFLLNPVGTFRGYGAYVGINPYREVATDAGPEKLGATIVELLGLSGPTGVPFSEATTHLKKTADTETTRIRREYGLEASGLSTSGLARCFLSAEVQQGYRQKSWRVQRYEYDSRRRPAVMSGARLSPRLVAHTAGVEALGVAVLRALELE